MLGHLYSFLLPPTNRSTLNAIRFPAIALVVSGGHTALLLLKSLTIYKKLGETRDDAAGEAFDKVARLLSLAYPGGPEIEKLARGGNPRAIEFPRPMLNQKNFDFSFSGLKTAVLYYLRDAKGRQKKNKADIAASFEQALFDVLIKKTIRAAQEHKARAIILTGGVSASKELRRQLADAIADLNLRMNANQRKRKIRFLVPAFQFSTDNAAMIGAAAYVSYLEKRNLPLEADGTLDF